MLDVLGTNDFGFQNFLSLLSARRSTHDFSCGMGCRTGGSIEDNLSEIEQAIPCFSVNGECSFDRWSHCVSDSNPSPFRYFNQYLVVVSTSRGWISTHNNNNDNGYFSVLFLRRAHSPFIKNKNKLQQRCEHRIRKNKQIKSTVHDANKKERNKQTMCQ